VNKIYIKSSTYNKRENNISFNINNLNDNSTNREQIQKSRTSENDNFHYSSFTLRLNNLGQNRLETVLETVSEASNSKVDSSEISDEDGNNGNNINTGKNEVIENKKIKEDFGNSNNTEQKMQGTDTKINDSEYNAANKKSLYFLSSEKTH
jgi:hypothetical protein